MKNLVVSLIYSIAVITPLLAQPPVTVYAQASKQSSFLKLTAEDYYVYSTSFLLSRIDGIDTLDGLTQAIHLDPNFAEAYYARSIWQKTEKLSIQDLTQAIRVNPNFADAYYKRGLLYYRSGNTKAALEDINYAIRISSENDSFYLLRARIKDSLGDKKAATEDYIEAVKYKSLEDSADEEIVQEFRKATSNASQIIQTSPDFAYIYYRGLAGKKRDIETVEIEKSGIEITGDMDTDSSLAITENLSQATQLKPDSAEAFYYKGLSRRYLPAEAIADLTQAIQLNPNFLEAYLFRGLIQSKDSINQGDRDTLSAIRDFSQVIKLNPNLASAYYHRGVLLPKLRDNAHAIQDLSKALSIDAKNRSTIYNQNEVEECLSTLKNAPKTAKNYLDRGIVRHKLGDILGSRADLNRAIRLNPKLSEAYFERALLAQSLLRSTDALSDFNQAIRLNPNFGDAHFERALLYTHWSAGGPLPEQKPQMFADFDIAIRLNFQLAAQGFFALGASRELSKQSLGDYLQAVFLDPNFYEAYAYSHTYSQGWNNDGSLIQPYSVSNFIKSERQNAEYLVKERTQTIQRNPQDAIAFYSRGHAQLKLGQLQAAEEDFTQAKSRTPPQADGV